MDNNNDNDDDNDDCSVIGDELIAGSDIGNGIHPFIRHTSDHQIVGGTMTVVPDGKPCNGTELVKLTRIEGRRYKVESVYDGSTKKGPSTVVSDKYRSGWDMIWGTKPAGQA